MKWRFSESVIIVLCILTGIAALIAQGPDTHLADTWSINHWLSSTGRVHLQLTRTTLTSRWSTGHDYPIEELRGLNRDSLTSMRANVRFEIERDAGTILCEGVLTAGFGGGPFAFSPNRSFTDAMGKLDFSDLTMDQLFSMALSDVSLAYVRQMKQLNLRDLSASQLIRLRERQITPEFIAEIRSHGYDYSTGDFIRLKDHGVQPMFLRELKQGGYNLDAEEVVRLHDHGVGSNYVRNLEEAKYHFTAEQLIRLHDHGVGYDYIRALKDSAYEFPAETMIRLKDNGVSADFPRDLRAAGYNDVAPHDMIRMWQNGVNGSYVARLQASGMKRLTPEQIIKLKQHGVD